METAIVSLICIALIVLGGMTISQSFLDSVDSTSSGLEEMGDRAGEIMRTELSPLSGSQSQAEVLDIWLGNDGQTKLGSFDKWDVIVQYYDGGGSYHITWLPYTEEVPGDNKWTIAGIYLDVESSTPEAFEPDILNPGEDVAIEARLDPPVGAGTTNMVIVATPNGIATVIPFAGYQP